MSDGMPTDEQLRRIERGVQRRIDLRRTVARRVAGTTAAVALLGGGFALLVPLGLGSASGGGSTSGGSAAGGSAVEQVVCHGSSARDSSSVQREAPADADDRRLIEACGGAAVDFQSGSGRLPSATSGGGAASGGPSGSPSVTGQGASGGGDEAPASSPAASSSSALTSGSASPSLRGPAVVCEATDGLLHVFPADSRPATLCERNGMRTR